MNDEAAVQAIGLSFLKDYCAIYYAKIIDLLCQNGYNINHGGNDYA